MLKAHKDGRFASKLAFVHIVRTGGTAVMDMFHHSKQFTIYNSWSRNMRRDWTTEELTQWLNIKSHERCLLHNHVFSWSLPLVKMARRKKWFVFTVVRDPVDQLVSLYNKFIYKTGVEFEAFVKYQINKNEGGWDYRHWEIPEYWPELNMIIMYKSQLSTELDARFGVKLLPIYRNQSPRRIAPSKQVISIIENSEFYQRFLEVKKHIEDENVG